MAQLLETALFSLEEVVMRAQIPAWQLRFFSLSSFFYPLAFYFLFSLLTLLASRDFFENVFLVMRNLYLLTGKTNVSVFLNNDY